MALEYGNGKVTAAEKARVRRALSSGRDFAPSVRSQSSAFVNWGEAGQVLGQPFDATKIPLSKLYQMRKDPMIAFALQFIRVPLIRSQWYIEAEDAQVAAFVDYALRRIWGRFVMQWTQSMDFGYQAIVKRFEYDRPNAVYVDPNDPEGIEKPIWDEGNVDAIVFKPFVALRPEAVNPIWTPTGEFDGIKIDQKTQVRGFPYRQSQQDEDVKVPVEFSLWVTNDRESEFGSVWGYPRIGHAYRYWWSYWYRWALADRHFEKDADPSMLVYYPDSPEDRVIDDATGQEINYREIALALGEQMRSGSTIAAPGGTIAGFDDRPTNLREWDFKFIEGGTNFQSFTESFEYLDIQKIRSIFLPEQAFFEGRGGTSSRNVAAEMSDLFEKSQAVTMEDIDECVNRWIIPQLVQANFPEYTGRVCKKTRGFGDEDKALAQQLVTLVGQSDPSQLGVDVRRILDEAGVPVLSIQEMKRRQEEAIAQAQAMAPPTTPGADGNAAVQQTPDQGSATGFSQRYVQMPQSLNLSLQDTFLQRLPATRHYRDPQVREITVSTRAFWRDMFAEVYEDFAQHLEAVGLADDGLDAMYFDAKDVPNKPGVSNWVEKHGHLPKFIADIAGDLITQRGMKTSRAIATAVAVCKRWSSGAGDVSAKTRSKAAAALAQWEKMRASAHADLAEALNLLELADHSDKPSRILSGWKGLRAKAETISNFMGDALFSVVSRAGSLELQSANLAADFKVEDQQVVDWVNEHGAGLVRGIDETLRQELRGFLASQLEAGTSINEIAGAVRDHFSGFPDWKADRLARTEVKDAYNVATLLAAHQQGVDHVQALDASHGTNPDTDEECVRRNGRFFKISDALQELDHPNGTLEWRIIPSRANLSIEYALDQDMLAYFDESSDTVFLRTDITDEQAARYLRSLGDVLSRV